VKCQSSFFVVGKPYVGGREYDLTEATARKLRFRGHGAILTTD
jgi:hypothetical protein